MAARDYGQYCGVVSALELVGERWALIIVRDLLVGPRRYTDLKAGLPRIPTNILSTRLKELQSGGVVRRVPLAGCGLVYELTEYGRELDDVIVALGRWGFKTMGDPSESEIVTKDSMTTAFRTAFRSEAATTSAPAAYRVHIGDVDLTLRIDHAGLSVLPSSDAPGTDAGSVDVEFAAGPAIRHLISGEVTAGEAIDQGIVHVLHGNPKLLDRFAATFHLEPLGAAS